LLCVFFQTPIAHFYETELALDHPKWMLDFGAHARFELFCLFLQSIYYTVFLQRPALAWAHDKMAGNVGICIG
jgi:hypothetical protein